MQAECLNLDGVLDGKNLVYCAPTSGGKSLVSEVLMLRRVLTTGKVAMLVLPYNALCSQKADELEELLAPVERSVKAMFGGKGTGAALPPDTGELWPREGTAGGWLGGGSVGPEASSRGQGGGSRVKVDWQASRAATAYFLAEALATKHSELDTLAEVDSTLYLWVLACCMASQQSDASMTGLFLVCLWAMCAVTVALRVAPACCSCRC